MWAGTHWPSFAPAMGVAMVAFLLNLVLANSATFIRIFPWALPVNFVVGGLDFSGRLINWEIAQSSIFISVAVATVVVVMSSWQITRRDVM
jgi:hypothetical protein